MFLPSHSFKHFTHINSFKLQVDFIIIPTLQMSKLRQKDLSHLLKASS